MGKKGIMSGAQTSGAIADKAAPLTPCIWQENARCDLYSSYKIFLALLSIPLFFSKIFHQGT